MNQEQKSQELAPEKKPKKEKIYHYNRWASWSLFLSASWGFGLFSLLGIALGIIAILKIKQSEIRQKGMFRAITALVIGANGLIFALVNLSAFKEMFAW